MKKVLSTLAIIPLLAAVLPAQRPWQEITFPSVKDVAANFREPPHEYGAIQPFMSWNGRTPTRGRQGSSTISTGSGPVMSSW